MSEQQQTGSDEATTPVSDTAEQGTSADIGRVTEGDSTGGAPQEAIGTTEPDVNDGTEPGDEANEGDQPLSYAPDEEPDKAEQERREANRTKPVWDVRTHGPLGEDDDRRSRYEIVGE